MTQPKGDWAIQSVKSIVRSLNARSRRLLQKGLMRLGYRIVRLSEYESAHLKSGDRARNSVPDDLFAVLNDKNPRLQELRERYGRVRTPMAQRTMWRAAHLDHGLQLPFFRADNAYVWQGRNVPADLRRSYYLFARYIAERDPRSLLHTLTEDGAFGCWTHDYHSLPRISRDLLDSINEMYFLDRVMGLFDRRDFRVLDVGAGYGRLAHRMSMAVPGLERYYCVDAVPESTFLSEFYLRYRGCAAKTTVIPLDKLEVMLEGVKIDLAINIHSFSEIGYEAIEGWVSLVARLGIPNFLIVPNHSDQLLSWEIDLSNRDFLPLLQSAGYRLKRKEPIFLDSDIRELTRIHDHFFFFERG